MNKKKWIAIALAIVFSVSLIYVGYNKIKAHKNKETSSIEVQNNQENSQKNDKETQIDKKENPKNKNGFIVPNGFLTSINPNGTEAEIIANNNLLENSKFTVEDRLKAKNVAENFAQAINTFDISDPKGTIEKATMCVSDDLKPQVEGLFVNLGKYDDIKKCYSSKIYSSQSSDSNMNDYITFYVDNETKIIDKHNQEDWGKIGTYDIKLLKINGEWKVVEFKNS